MTALVVWIGVGAFGLLIALETRLIRRRRVRRSVLDALAWYDRQGRMQ